MSKIQAIRGMNDILPAETPTWQYIEQVTQGLVQSYGYREIRFPVLEQSQLFKRSIGEVTDIVEKEMYSFADRNGDELSLRPEGTAGCVRAAEQHGLLYNQQQRLWYRGPMFRHERPQKGRYRQFHQVGIESFGMAGPDIDAEIILISAALWRALGLSQSVRLEINNIGTAADRKAFGAALMTFLQQHEADLDDDSRRRLLSNPLRVLDSKVPATQALLVDAPSLSEFVSPDTTAHYDTLKQLLRANQVEFVENPRLVRGLDYYNNMVFEWITDELGAQGTVCAGGRYDSLVAQLGGRGTPAVGLAFGMERLVLLMEAAGRLPESVNQVLDVTVLASDGVDTEQMLTLAEQLRASLPGVRIMTLCGGGKFNSQLKKAYNSGARVAVIVDPAPGTDEQTVRLRHLDDEGRTESIAVSGIVGALTRVLETVPATA
ncbi:histidine--tRNA ligase [Pseudohongiella sp.]|uniref:Aminoacyl-transfer RNA synthetases class-II family profile domain-containing protein n=1 Tax=marine sediment metagenome TaxID=412755 RepID=A0A0F9YFQ6_9ZZZZ|nr:histidine--tRNA ligase [Pseudohongiella sp.]HDZ09556.1 histidine--tRNA ligase [Pseudohongiella sp.]HEA62622.1 histidine--tRNA ligase [Pseudohongiella sp.]